MKRIIYESLKNLVFERYGLLMLKKYPELGRSIKNNRKFKNIHQKERCFILGNAPSLRTVDLELLADEFVFSVNYFTELDGFEKAGTNVHLWTDPRFFELWEDPCLEVTRRRFKKNYHQISELKPVCFVPSGAFPYIKKHRLDQLLDIHYLLVSKTFTECGINRINLCGGVYGCTTVVQFAIQVAAYMGFQEIYLLGCDSTNVLTLLETILGNNVKDRHAYNCDEKENIRNSRKLRSSLKTSDVLYDQYLLFEGYNRLNQYCHAHGIRLKNASEPTLITGLEKADINKILIR